MATEQAIGNNSSQSQPCEKTISTDKTKEVDKMVQISKRIESTDDDEVCIIDDSPVKVNGKHENIKIERMEEDDIDHDKIEDVISDQVSVDHVPEVISKEEIQINGTEGDSTSNKSNPPIEEENIINITDQVPNIADSKSEETVPIIQHATEKEIEVVNKTKPNYKRPRSATPVDDIQPTKRLKTELEQSFVGHNKRVQEYIEKTTNNSIDEINNHLQGLLSEVQELHVLATAKEQEWNNILYLTSVKEEIIHRLTRRKAVMEINSTKVGEVEDYTILEQQPSLSEKITKENRNSLQLGYPSHTSNQNSSMPTSFTTEAAKAIFNRASMKTSELAGERVTTAGLHRYVNRMLHALHEFYVFFMLRFLFSLTYNELSRTL